MPGVRWLTGMGEVAYARTPMGMRIPNLAVARISAIYGKCDWMSLIALDCSACASWMSVIARVLNQAECAPDGPPPLIAGEHDCMD